MKSDVEYDNSQIIEEQPEVKEQGTRSGPPEEELSEENLDILRRLKELFKSKELLQAHNLCSYDHAKVESETFRVDSILKHIPMSDIGEMQQFIKAAAFLVGERIGVKARKIKENKKPFWQRRIEGDIKRLCKDISRIERWHQGKWKCGN